MSSGANGVSIHAPREGRDTYIGQILCLHRTQGFNPRAPRRARPDHQCKHPVLSPSKVSIHAPREGRDVRVSYSSAVERLSLFQSTRPAKGATDLGYRPAKAAGKELFQSTRPAKGATMRIQGVSPQGARQTVSIHAPREGRDSSDYSNKCAGLQLQSFNPRAPRRARR